MDWNGGAPGLKELRSLSFDIRLSPSVNSLNRSYKIDLGAKCLDAVKGAEHVDAHSMV